LSVFLVAETATYRTLGYGEKRDLKPTPHSRRTWSWPACRWAYSWTSMSPHWSTARPASCAPIFWSSLLPSPVLS